MPYMKFYLNTGHEFNTKFKFAQNANSDNTVSSSFLFHLSYPTTCNALPLTNLKILVPSPTKIPFSIIKSNVNFSSLETHLFPLGYSASGSEFLAFIQDRGWQTFPMKIERVFVFGATEPMLKLLSSALVA
jgi:hypothetical protein